MILRGARVACGPRQARRADIEIARGRVRTIGAVPGARGLDLGGYIVLPGLINAHDHLEFNLFPRLGQGPYESSADWARDIQKNCRPAIDNVLTVPKRDRLIWGGIRNLLCGITSVCHHNPWEKIFTGRFPVRVVRRFSWAHSLEFSPDLVTRFKACPQSEPFVFHAGEAVNGAGQREMATLSKLGLLAQNSVMVHAVALDAASIAEIRARGCAVVWCPSSNLFILGRTVARELLDSDVPVALGTDSALTAEGDMIDELRVARRVSGLSEARLYRMVTDVAAEVLRLDHGEGVIRPDGVADLCVFRDRGAHPAEVIFRHRPDAVFIAGRLQLMSEDFATRFGQDLSGAARFHRLNVVGCGTVLLRAKPPAMPAGLRLAGREVTT